jgi:hemoglobin-like flavoprotein
VTEHDVLRDVSLDTMDDYIAKEYDAGTRNAWAKLYDIVAGEMIDSNY